MIKRKINNDNSKQILNFKDLVPTVKVQNNKPKNNNPIEKKSYFKPCSLTKMDVGLGAQIRKDLSKFSEETIRRLLIKMLQMEILHEKLEKFDK